MLTLRKSQDRGQADHGWLKSFHSFSFAEYYDPAHMGWGNLRVINEDFIAAGTGFGMHGHRDMEIVTYVTAGSLSHQDSMGNGETIRPGEVQRMSAGRGVMHSEFNHDQAGLTHLFQIWIQPHSRGIAPSYEQKAFDPAEKRGRLRLIASPDGADASLAFSADARIYAGLFDGDESASLLLRPGRKAYVHVVRGPIVVSACTLTTGDAALIADETCISLQQGQDAEVLVFDLSA